jgi:hypothetical protein
MPLEAIFEALMPLESLEILQALGVCYNLCGL